MSDDRICPICARDMEDRRHVGVECFYDVHSVTPQAEKITFFREVATKGSYWGTTRRYEEGRRDKFRLESTGPNSSRMINEPVKCEPIRLLEIDLFSIECCKSCRGDFLTLFGEWASGTYVTRHEPDDIHNIPIRQHGRTVYVSQADWEQRKLDRRA